MPLYSYKAISPQGNTLHGILEAGCAEELESSLAHSNLFLIHARKHLLRGRHPIRRRDLITFFLNLELMLASGIPLLESLSELQSSMDERQLRDIAASLSEAIQGGASLSQALGRHPHAFNKVVVSLIHAGEESGRLTEMIGHITAALKWQDEMSAQTRNMLLYPMFAGTVVLAAAAFLMVYLAPQLAQFIHGMGRDLPWQTELLFGISGLLSNYWPFLLMLPALLAILILLVPQFHPELQYRLDSLKLRCWPIGPILHKIILARFAAAFAMMYASGISILDCIAHSRDLAGNRLIAERLEQVARDIEAGASLSQGLRNAGVIPQLAMRMIAIGEASGQLEAAMRNVSYFYERDVKESAKRIQTLLEPAMTVTLGLLLGWVMLSVLSPIYEIISGVRL